MNGLQFDISDDAQFKAFVVQQFGVLTERSTGLADLKIDVPVLKQELKDLREDFQDAKKWENLKHATGPLMVILHIAAKKIGINI